MSDSERFLSGQRFDEMLWLLLAHGGPYQRLIRKAHAYRATLHTHHLTMRSMVLRPLFFLYPSPASYSRLYH
jgi:hypothetical protein